MRECDTFTSISHFPRRLVRHDHLYSRYRRRPSFFAKNSASLDIPRVADIQSPSRFQSLSLTVVFSAGISKKEPAELERVLAFDRVARTRNVICADNTPRSFSFTLFPLRLSLLEKRFFLVLIARGKRGGALCVRARAFGVSRGSPGARMRFRVSACCFSS